MEELNKHLMKMVDAAFEGLKKMQNKIMAAQYKLVFSAYEKDEVLVFGYEFAYFEENVISLLKAADMSRPKAVYINSWAAVGDCVASKLASRLKAHPVSALYLRGHHISDAGAQVLAQAAFRNKSLSAFCMESENISDTGAKSVAEVTRNCH